MTPPELYRSPTREEIAAKVLGTLPGASEAAGAPPEPQQPDYMGRFAMHLKARMRAIGWDQARLQEEGGISSHIAARAINGTACDIPVAARIAGLVGGSLPAMLVPYRCSTCQGDPPVGYACLECGTEVRQPSGTGRTT